MSLPRVRVSQLDPHALETADGRPFFLLGDTAWRLLELLTLEEIEFYCANRAAKGFNAFATVVLSEFDPHPAALIEDDPTRPNEAFFERIDRTFDLAERHGLYVLLLPTWGDKVTAPWGIGPRLFTVDRLDVVDAYSRYVARRYADRTNLIWVLGGDRPARVDAKINPFHTNVVTEGGFPPDVDWTPIWRTMARAILEETDGRALITYHPQGGSQSTSSFLHAEPWLHVNMMQSGHGGGHDVPVWEWIARDRALEPAKPTLDGEPNYEDHLVSPWPTWDPATGRFRAEHVRRQCYRSTFAGGCGVIYGHHCVWQMWDVDREPIMLPEFTWREALDRPGATEVGRLRGLLEGFGGEFRRPAPELFLDAPRSGRERLESTRVDGRALVYFPTGAASRIATDGFTKAEWFDPRTGGSIPASATDDGQFCPPTDDDWVLVLES